MSSAVNRDAVIFILCGFGDISCIFPESILIVKGFLILKSRSRNILRVRLKVARAEVLKLLPHHGVEGLDVTFDGV